MRYSALMPVLLALICAACSLQPAHAAAQEPNSAIDPQLQQANQFIAQAEAARNDRDFKNAIALYEKALALRVSVLGAEHSDLVSVLDALAAVHRDTGDRTAAVNYYERSAAIIEKVAGPEALPFAASLNRLALMYSSMGESAKALTLQQRSLAITEKLLGSEHPSVATNLNNLAELYRSIGDYAKALPLYERSLAMYEKVLGPDDPSVAMALNNLGALYWNTNQYAKALPLFERSLAINEAALGPEDQQVATSLNNLALLHSAMGEYARALPLQERSLAIVEKLFGAEHAYVSAGLNNLALLYSAMGEYAKALPLQERSLAIAEKTFGPRHPEVAAILSNIANLYRDVGQYARALPLDERGLAIRERAFGPNHPAVAISLDSLARLYGGMGEYSKAIPLYERCLAILDKAVGPENLQLATCLDNLAGIYVNTGRYAQSLPLYRRSLAIREKVLGSSHPDVAKSLNNMASAYQNLGDHAQAVSLIERSLAISEKAVGAEHPDRATFLDNLALVYESQGDYATALPLHERSLAISEKAFGPEHESVAVSLHNLARFYKMTGDYAKSLPLYRRSLSIFEKTLGPDHPRVAVSLSNLAGLYGALGDYAKALPLDERALSIASSAGAPDVVWPAQNGLRVALTHLGRRDLAIFFGKEAVNTIQGLRAGLSALDSTLQRSFLRDKEAVYRELADVLIDEGRLPEAQQVLAMLKEEEFFDFIRRDGKQDSRSTQADYTPAEQDWQQRYQAIAGRLGEIGQGLAALNAKAKLGLSSAEQAQREQLRADQRVAQQGFDRFLGDLMKELAAASAERNREVGERNLTRLRALQATLGALGEGVLALHYVIGQDKLRVIVTTPTIQIARERAISAKQLNAKIQALREALSNPGSNPKPAAQALYEDVIGPIAADLKQLKAQTLMVSLDGALRYVPLAALYDGRRYLVEDYRIALYTEAAKDKLKDAPQPHWRVVGLGLTHAVQNAQRSFDALPAVRQELEGIVRVGERGVLPGAVYLDDAFTAQRLREVLDQSYPVLHIASHFVFRPGNESNSFLLLGDGTPLSLVDLRQDDFDFGQVDLITLSACETAVGGGLDGNGREIEGFGALAQERGAKGVIASLWQVADESTGILMQSLYRIREQNEHMNKAEALREAQLQFIHGQVQPSASTTERGLSRANRPAPPSADAAQRYTHPYYWAPFILMGNWL